MLVSDLVAETWQGQLQDGGRVLVDPETRRATGLIDGEQQPLWDGVHRLEDGSTIIVRDGVAVPSAPMLERWDRDAKPEPVYAQRFCDQLVRKTCGFDDACSATAPCLQARSLLTESRSEQLSEHAASQDANIRHSQTATGERCRAALDQEVQFPACQSLAAAGGDSRCRALVARTCGADDRCADSPACDAARQLQGLETQERLTNADPSALSLTGQQCLEAMDNAFFAACESR